MSFHFNNFNFNTTKEQVLKICPDAQFVNNWGLQHTDHPPVWLCCSSCTRCGAKDKCKPPRQCIRHQYFLCENCQVCLECKRIGLKRCKELK